MGAGRGGLRRRRLVTWGYVPRKRDEDVGVKMYKKKSQSIEDGEEYKEGRGEKGHSSPDSGRSFTPGRERLVKGEKAVNKPHSH